MTFLLRILGAIAIGALLRRLPTANPAVEGRANRLSWSKKRELVWELTKDDRVPLGARFLIALPALYMMSPLDLLPDFIPFIGRADDAAAFALVLQLVTRLAPPGVIEAQLARLESRF
jgi:uncharacterized membrane protein YkvA (DUF1232 family)